MSPEQLEQLSSLVGRWTGLHFPRERWTELERGVVRASKEFGHSDAESFVTRLASSSLTNDQIQTLAWHLTIGETYFLRGGSAFVALEKKIIPKLVAEREKSTRQIRIWSAGCAGGEEPYSLAVTVARAIPDLKDWRVTILATDINTRALERARAGVYGSWSFRDTPDWLRKRYFTEAGSDKWALIPQIQKMVTFSYLNLALDPYPSLLTNTYAMDVVFCRNVMMYFSRDLMKQVVGNFHAALRDGGSFFTAPSEASHEYFPQFGRAVECGEVFFVKTPAPAKGAEKPATSSAAAKGAEKPAAGKSAPGRAAPPASRPRAAAPAGRPPRPVPAHAPAAAAAKPGDAAAELAAEARANANLGKLDEALGKCAAAIAADKLSAAYRYLSATILQELDRPDEAVKALSSALYLDHDFVLAHFLLGNIARARSRFAEADTHFARALRLLEELPPEAELPEADGLTAGRLSEIVRAIRATEMA
jgi:chemotaxis protein methyltransferase CheR